MNIVKKIRNNWKKTVFGISVLAYTTNYLYKRNQTNRLHQAYCYESLKFSKEKIPPMQKLRRITVFLNPISNNDNSKTLFDKYVAPMLHLSGLDVRVVRLDSKSDTKDYMSVINDEDTDCIVIAGGNATLSEVVTTLVNRPDAEKLFQRIKIGIIPLGKTNTFIENLFNLNLEKNQVELLGKTTLSIIKGDVYPVDLMQVNFNADQQQPIKTVYALSNVAYGYLSDKHATFDNYWYYGPLKSHISNYYSLRLAYFNRNSFDLSYFNYCNECKRCFKAKNEKYFKKLESNENAQVNQNETNNNKSVLRSLFLLFYKKFISRKERKEAEQRRLLEYKLTQLNDNYDCGVQHEFIDGRIELAQLDANINKFDRKTSKSSNGIAFVMHQLPKSLYRNTMLTNMLSSENKKQALINETQLNLSEFQINNIEQLKHSFIIDNEVFNLDEINNLKTINVKYLEKKLNFLIDFNLVKNNNKIKQNKNVNLYLSDYNINNSINYTSEALNLNLIEPFKKLYYSFLG